MSFKETKLDANGNPINNNVSMRILVQPTERSQILLNDIFFCLHNSTCDLSNEEYAINVHGRDYKTFKGRSFASACSMFDTWVIFDKQNTDGQYPEENANLKCSFLEILSGNGGECDLTSPAGRHLPLSIDCALLWALVLPHVVQSPI